MDVANRLVVRAQAKGLLTNDGLTASVEEEALA